MKKLLLISLATVFIGNITGQSTQGFSPCTCSNCSKPQNESSTVQGVVVDATTGEAIPFAVIQITDGGSTNLGVMTDAQGAYAVNKIHPGSYKMKVTSIGYTSHEQSLTLQSGSVIMKQVVLQEKTLCVCSMTILAESETSTPADLEETPDITKSSQGPFTGLEGHNFIEDPAIIYPNPVKETLNIKSTDPITVIEILGINGQVEKELDPRSSMDVSDLAAGTYYVRIHFENIKEVQVEKILIVK